MLNFFSRLVGGVIREFRHHLLLVSLLAFFINSTTQAVNIGYENTT